MGVQLGLVDKSGAWYAYKGDKIGQGKSNACDYLKENKAVRDEIEAAIRAQMLAVPVVASASEEVTAEADD